jgi:hypothetical protein
MVCYTTVERTRFANGVEVMESAKSSDHGAVAKLVGPRMPADLGLAGLGLLMQLAGTLGLALFTALALIPFFLPESALFADGPNSAFLFFGAVGSAIRAATHRAAGSALLYGGTGRPLRTVWTYVAVATLHTAIALAALHQIGLGGPGLARLGALLLAWPIAVTAIFSAARFRAAARGGASVSEDLGFESTAVLMALFGVVGALVAGLALAYTLQAPTRYLVSPPILVLTLVLAVLLVRSILQIVAGFKGTAGLSFHAANQGTARYCNFGVLSAILVGSAVFVELFLIGHVPGALLCGATTGALLLAWPAILRRFYAERNFSVLLAGEQAPRFRRAPDAGLTALGWFLLALGALELSNALPAALLGTEEAAAALLGGGESGDSPLIAHSRWWMVGVASLQLWAAIELIRMTDRFRLAASLYAVVAIAITGYQCWAYFGALDAILETSAGVGPDFAIRLSIVGHAAFGLVVAAAAFLLANRVATPEAVAHTRGHARKSRRGRIT